jgi:outer membrane protein
MQQNLQKIAQESEIKLANREMELTKPIYKRINEAIEKVAKENDYAYVMAKDRFIYASGGIDATAKVRTVLGLSW